MGSMVEEAIYTSVEALKQRDFATSKRVYQNDAKINQMHFEIENNCITVIATQQPMA
jgi:phosphate transport system protein